MTKRQRRNLEKLIERYAEAREQKYWQLDQGTGAAVAIAVDECVRTKYWLDRYLTRLETV